MQPADPSTGAAPSLSVVMPNYNDSAYLREAVDAILDQSYRSLELIVVDDASTDDSFRILSEYAARDPRMRLFRNERNCGCVPTINRGLREARGRYLYLASSNDKVLPGFFEKTIRLLEAHPQAELCWTDPSHFFESYGPVYGRPMGLSTTPEYIPPEKIVDLYASGRLTTPLFGTPAMFVREAFERAGGYYPELKWHCDYFPTTVVAFRTGMCSIPETLTSARILPGSFWSSGVSRRGPEARIVGRLLDLLLSSDFNDVRERFIRSKALTYFGMTLFHLANRNARHRRFLPTEQVLRALMFGLKRQARNFSSISFQRTYFRIRQSLRSRALGLDPRRAGAPAAGGLA